VSALEELARREAPATLRSGRGEPPAALGGLMAGLATALEAATLPGGEEPAVDRWRLFAALAVFFERLAARGPAVLVLDDLHTADEDSLHLLHYLSGGQGERPLLVLGTCRGE